MSSIGDPLQHLESFLGRFSDAWGERDQGIRVLRFAERPRSGTSVFSTLGVSDRVVKLPSGGSLRQEFVVVLDDSEAKLNGVARFLAGVASDVLETGRAPVRGEVLGPKASVLGSQLTALYCALPVFLPDGFAECRSSLPPTVFVWLIPIWQSEAEDVRSRGWMQFETALEKADPNLFSLRRMPLP